MRLATAAALSRPRVTCWPTIGARFESKASRKSSTSRRVGSPSGPKPKPSGTKTFENGTIEMKRKIVSMPPLWSMPKPRIWSPWCEKSPCGTKIGAGGIPNMPTFW